jgi:peptide/nickel transport system permease protein
MTGFVLRRVAQAVIVVLGVTLLTFMLEHLIPGNLARGIIGPRATPQQIAQFDAQYGLNKSLPLQYLSFLGQLIHGNLGYSFKQNRSVDSIISQYLPRDAILVGLSLLLALVIAIPMGIVQAIKRNKIVDYIGTGVSFVLYSMPSYWLALLLIAAFAVGLKVLPSEAPQAASVGGIISQPSGLILPVATLTLVTVALFSRYMRSSAIDTLTQDFVRTARAKGLKDGRIHVHHVLRNSLIPIVTLVGLSLPGIFTAGLVVEFVFNFQGLGLAYYNAALTSDYPVELGLTVLIGVVTVGGNLLADVVYAVLDPRVRYQR